MRVIAYNGGIIDMSEIEEIREIKDQGVQEINTHYRAARRAGEMLLNESLIHFEDYRIWMQGFEKMLKDRGVNL